MTWILQHRGLIFGVIAIVVPLVVMGWFFGTKKYKHGRKNERLNCE